MQIAKPFGTQMLSSKDEAREMAVKGIEALASQCSDSSAVETLLKVSSEEPFSWKMNQYSCPHIEKNIKTKKSIGDMIYFIQLK